MWPSHGQHLTLHFYAPSNPRPAWPANTDKYMVCRLWLSEYSNYCYFSCDMDADNNLPLVIPPQLYERLQNMDQERAYGILYDVYMRRMKDNLPSG